MSMAEKVEPNRNPFGPFTNGFGYDQAFDGCIWRLRRGEDFDKAAGTVAAEIRDEHRLRFGHLEIKVDDDTVIVQHVSGTNQ